MFDLPEEWLKIVSALVDGPVAWQTPAELASALKWDIEATSDVLALLDEAGWVQVWEQEAGPVVTLSPLGAERLGVRLAEFGAGEITRWIKAGEPEPPPSRAQHVCTRERAAGLNYVVDPQPGPLLAAENAEALARYAEFLTAHERAGFRYDQAPPWPTTLIGLSLTPWPGPWRDSDGECPACGNIRLEHSMYCLYCDRWGLDGIFATVRRQRRGPGAGTSESQALEREAARASRRARRRARFAKKNQGGQPPNGRNGHSEPDGTSLAGS